MKVGAVKVLLSLRGFTEYLSLRSLFVVRFVEIRHNRSAGSCAEHL